MSGAGKDAPDCAGHSGGHTQGPWRFETYQDNVEIIGRPSWPCSRFDESGEWTIAVLDDLVCGHAGELAANARLIAAAPELLEALREALPGIEQRENRLGFSLPEGDAARAAIRKATQP